MLFSLALLTSLLAITSVNGNIQNGVPDSAPPGFSAYISPLVVPSPNVTGSGDWRSAIQRAKAFVAKLSLEEKVNITTGAGIQGRCVGNTGAVPRLGFAGLCLNDSPLSVRFADFVSLFPAGISAASTFDKSLIHRRGVALGKEHRGKGVNVHLGPMMNMQRAPAAGRIWEGFGGDPYLTGVCSVETIHGVQSQGVIACAKHFIGNEQEHYRGGSGAQTASSDIDDRTMHEIYSWPFAESVRAGVGSVMASYNRINQTFATENSYILNGILKEEFDFQGFVVTDWAAAVSGVNTALAGTDMNMPGFMQYGNENQDNPAVSTNSYWGANLVTAVKNGSVPLYRLDDMVTRIMGAYYKMNQNSPNFPKVNFDQFTRDTYLNGVLVNEHVDVQGNHAQLIREIGGASTVLLKNDRNTLPLDVKSFKRWGIFGSDAGPNFNGPNSCSDRGCDEGSLGEGWGSGTGDYPYLIDPLSALQTYIHKSNPRAVIEGVLNDFNSAYQQVVARQADICLAFVNADSGEGYITVEGNAGDRNNLTLWHAGDDLISNVTSQCSNTVVVVHSVGPVDMEAWIENPNVTAVLWANLPGQESGNSIVDVLFGDGMSFISTAVDSCTDYLYILGNPVNPSARLPYTIGKHRTDYAADVLYTSNLTVPQILYSEKLLIDYRWFDAKNIVPRFEFGFGLSYTTFTYSRLDIQSLDRLRSTKRLSMKPDSSRLYDNVYTISFDVTNSGGVDGHEVSQLYLGFPKSSGEPPKVLRGFERTFLSQGQTKSVKMVLRKKDISIWNVAQQTWVVPAGKFTVYVGKSSRNIVLTGSFNP